MCRGHDDVTTLDRAGFAELGQSSLEDLERVRDAAREAWAVVSGHVIDAVGDLGSLIGDGYREHAMDSLMVRAIGGPVM